MFTGTAPQAVGLKDTTQHQSSSHDWIIILACELSLSLSLPLKPNNLIHFLHVKCFQDFIRTRSEYVGKLNWP